MWSTITAVLSLLPLALAAPSNPTGLDKRTPGNVYMCTGGGWGNTCGNVFIGTGSSYSATCRSLPEPYFASIGSAGPDQGALCRLFDSAHSDCSGTGLAILTYPGDDNLYGENDAGHKAQYIACITCTNCT